MQNRLLRVGVSRRWIAWCLAFFSVPTTLAEITTVINAPPTVIAANTDLADGTRLNVGIGGEVGGNLSLGQNAVAGQKVELVMSGGNIGGDVEVWPGGSVEITGGRIEGLVDLNFGGRIDLSGGWIEDLILRDGSSGRWAGGVIAEPFNVGGVRPNRAPSYLELVGAGWMADGVPVDSIPLEFSLLDDNGSHTFSGVLADGRPFVLAGHSINIEPRVFVSVNPERVAGDFFDATGVTLTAVVIPEVSLAPIVLADNNAPLGLRPGQTLTVLAQGDVGDDFASLYSQLTLEGGSVGDRFSASGGRIEVNAGTVGADVLLADEAEFVLRGGSVGPGLIAVGGSALHMEGGTITGDVVVEAGGPAVALLGGTITGGLVVEGRELQMTPGLGPEVAPKVRGIIFLSEGANASLESDHAPGSVQVSNSALTLTGGTEDTAIAVFEGSTVTIAGGVTSLAFTNSLSQLPRQVIVEGGRITNNVSVSDEFDTLEIRGGSWARGFRATSGEVEISGSDFRLNGEPVTTLPELPNGATFTATLSDGTPLIWIGGRETINMSSDSFLSRAAPTLIETSIPAVNLAPIDLAIDPLPLGLRNGQAMRVRNGFMVPDDYQAIGATIDLENGTIGGNLELSGSTFNVSGGTVAPSMLAMQGSRVNVSGGTIERFSEFWGSELVISGGELEREALAAYGSTVTMTGGRVGDLTAINGSQVNISGGTVVSRVWMRDGSHAEISGGLFNGFLVDDGASARVSGGSFKDPIQGWSDATVELVGGEFYLNGVALADGNVPVASDFILTGTLADGTPFINRSKQGARLFEGSIRLTTVALPDSPATLLLGEGDTVPNGVRPGFEITLLPGAVMENYPRAVNGKLIVNGGEVGVRFGALDSHVRVESGSVGNFFSAYDGTSVELIGGTIGNNFGGSPGTSLMMSGGELGSNSSFTGGLISGGKVGSGLKVVGEQFKEISGGSFGSGFRVLAQSAVSISGGQFAAGLRFERYANVELAGGEFMLDGMAVTGIEGGLPDGSTFTATLSDGSVMILREDEGDRIDIFTTQLTPVPLPAIDPNPVVAPGQAVPLGLRPGQSLTLGAGATTVGYFAMVDASLNISGGVVAADAEALRSDISLSSGEIGRGFRAYEGTRVDMQGGVLGEGFRAYAGSELLASGGVLPDDLKIDAGARLEIQAASFFLNGVDITGTLTPGAVTPLDERFATLSGSFLDGSLFELEIGSRFPFPFPGQTGSISADADVFITLATSLILAGDYNGSGSVEQGDLDLVLNNWGGPRGAWSNSDGFVSGAVDQEELDGLLNNWGSSAAPNLAGLNVPEPRVAVILSIGLGLAVRLRRVSPA